MLIFAGDSAQIGRAGEDAAAEHVKRLGWKILARNWRHRQLELDLICRDSGTVVFVEVKTRAADGMTRPDEALTLAKRAKLVRAATAWLSKNAAWENPCRFDLANVIAQNGAYAVELMQNVIEFDLSNGNSLGGRHSALQPW